MRKTSKRYGVYRLNIDSAKGSCVGGYKWQEFPTKKEAQAELKSLIKNGEIGYLRITQETDVNAFWVFEDKDGLIQVKQGAYRPNESVILYCIKNSQRSAEKACQIHQKAQDFILHGKGRRSYVNQSREAQWIVGGDSELPEEW